MDAYAKSVESVDAALRRLNATLSSYKQSSPPSNPSLQPDRSASNGHSASRGSRDPLESANSPITNGYQGVHPEIWTELLSLRAIRTSPDHVSQTLVEPREEIPEISKSELQTCLADVQKIYDILSERPYCLPVYVLLARKFLQLGYPDLAAGAAYKALLLSDAVKDAADEYHEEAADALREVVQFQPLAERIRLLKSELHADMDDRQAWLQEGEDEIDVEVDVWCREHYTLLVYRHLSRSLILCGCYAAAREYLDRSRRMYGRDYELGWLQEMLREPLKTQLGLRQLNGTSHEHRRDWPKTGYVRRELYPWNTFEPDRLRDLDTLNAMIREVAPKLEVRAVSLPILANTGANGKQATVTQLGVFATEDIAPGDVVLDEISMLAANNKLQDALCDACSDDLPDLKHGNTGDAVACPDCEVVFCSRECFARATASYHPALCGMDVEPIAKDVPPAEAADSLFALLLLRTLAMAETQECHPLELKEVKYIWGDFHGLRLDEHWTPPSLQLEDITPRDASHGGLPRALPFSFENNVRLPFHMLEKMDIDIFANPQYDVWVFNTLYAKFRGTASARLSGLGGRAIRGPEVSAVHPLWCLANHSCDPNVKWEWGASIKFWAREERVGWEDGSGKLVRSQPGIKKGEEVLNHYCDIELPVKERREWASGSLGGDCMCDRCVWEDARQAKHRASHQ